MMKENYLQLHVSPVPETKGQLEGHQDFHHLFGSWDGKMRLQGQRFCWTSTETLPRHFLYWERKKEAN